MQLDLIPWKEGASAVLAGVLLKLFYDLVYKKIPKGFRDIQRCLDQTQKEFASMHHEAVDHMNSLEDAVRKLTEKNCQWPRNVVRRASVSKRKKPRRKKK